MASVSSSSGHAAARDLQVRSPRQLMASRRLQSNKSLIQEVRNSLTMPGSPPLTDEAMDNLSPISIIGTNHHLPSKKLAHARSSFHDTDAESVNSARSTKSSVSIFSTMFRRTGRQKANRHHTSNHDSNASVSSTKSWWQKTKKRRFKLKNPLKRGGGKKKSSNEQMVADFFDVQSVASAPELQQARPSRTLAVAAKADLETRSVTSQRSSGFRFLFRRNHKVDELESSDFFDGSGVIDMSEEMHILDDDEEITLGSGLDDSSYFSADGYSVDSRDSLKSIEERNDKKPATFLDRIVKRRKKKKRQTNLRKARPADATSLSETTSVASVDIDLDSKSRGGGGDRRSSITSSLQKSPLGKNRSVRSLNDLPTHQQQQQQQLHQQQQRSSLSRWDSGRSLVSDPHAPKKPQRQSEPPESSPKPSTAAANALPPPFASLETALAETKGVTRSMRDLSSHTCLYNNREQGDEENDDGSDGDDSVLSLLSGLLATWSEEQQKAMDRTLGIASSVSPAAQPHIRGILKTSKKLQEQKEADRQVVFDSIEIREYERIVGDNPSCTRGPPISIGWSYFVQQRCNVEYYETSLKPPRRNKKEFHMTADRRTQLLLEEWHYPEEELQKARREATYVQYCRAKTSFSGSRAAAKEAAFLRKANSRPKPPTSPLANPTSATGTIPLTRVAHHDLSVESVVSAAMVQQHQEQPYRKSPRANGSGSYAISRTRTGSFKNHATSLTMDVVTNRLESQA